MTLTLSTEYSVRLLLAMALRPEGMKHTINTLSTEQGIPEKFLRKIVPQLAKAEIIFSQKGNGGGISLARKGEEISLLDVVLAIEGDIFLNKCTFSETFCHRTPWCAVHGVWIEAQNQLKAFLATKSIKALAIKTTANKLTHTA